MFRGVTFKFRFADHSTSRSFFATRGQISEDGLKLGKTLLACKDIKSVSVREQKFVIGLTHIAEVPQYLKPHISNGNYMVLEIYRINLLTLKRMIDGILSRSNKTNSKNFIECPSCLSMLSKEKPAQYTYCTYCETIFTEKDITTDGLQYRKCDGCDFFGSVRFHTEFYFYGYIASNKWSLTYTHLCSNCSSSLFFKMLPLNAPFLLGLPSTLVIPIRSYMGQDVNLKGLAKATKLIQKKHTIKAEDIMKPMLETYENHPGLLYNLAIGWLSNDEQKKALNLLEQSLTSCPSYEHSHVLYKRIENFIDGTS